ncbi:MAG: stage II sporulation protein P [Oscillospiraceae bacterium]
MKIRLGSKARDIMKITACVLSLPIIYIAASKTMPYIEPLIERVAVFSASISFMPENRNILETDSNWENDFIEDSITGLSDSEVNIEYDETPVQEEIPSDTTSSAVETEIEKPANSGVIDRKTYVAGNTGVYINLKEGFIKNCTKLPVQKILDAVKKLPKFKIKANAKPEVLIMHTHATEGYQDTELGYFDKSDTTRTTDNTKNVTRVGDEIGKQLKEAGIGVIHDKTLHDYPSYNGAYERSAVTVKRILKANPTIKVVLDVHRDAIQPTADSMIAPVTTINGKKVAQVMIISGCDNGKMNMPNYMENLKLSVALQRQMEKDYKTLARPILFDYRKYNQNLTTGSILLEMGGHANTLDEAIYCGELVGKSLVKTLISLK